MTNFPLISILALMAIFVFSNKMSPCSLCDPQDSWWGMTCVSRRTCLSPKTGKPDPLGLLGMVSHRSCHPPESCLSCVAESDGAGTVMTRHLPAAWSAHALALFYFLVRGQASAVRAFELLLKMYLCLHFLLESGKQTLAMYLL